MLRGGSRGCRSWKGMSRQCMLRSRICRRCLGRLCAWWSRGYLRFVGTGMRVLGLLDTGLLILDGKVHARGV